MMQRNTSTAHCADSVEPHDMTNVVGEMIRQCSGICPRETRSHKTDNDFFYQGEQSKGSACLNLICPNQVKYKYCATTSRLRKASRLVHCLPLPMRDIQTLLITQVTVARGAGCRRHFISLR